MKKNESEKIKKTDENDLADEIEKETTAEESSGKTEVSDADEKKHGKAFVYTMKFIRGLCFFLILAILFPILTYMFTPKKNTNEGGMKDQNAHAFYAEPKNTIDTVIIGNSEAYSSFSPLEMWKSYGMTSYVSAQGAVIMSEAYYILKEILKNQSPSVVVFETDVLFQPKTDDVLRDRTFNNVMENEIPLLKYHDNWKIENPSQYFAPIKYTWQSYTRGQLVDSTIDPLETHDFQIEDGKDVEYKNGVISPYLRMYLDKMAELCRERNISFVLVTIPNTLTSSKQNCEAVTKYAESKNIVHLDFGTHPEYANIDWQKDTRDGGVHLNTVGAKKVSDYLGKYIKDHYNVPDRRKDKKLAKRWNKDYKRYQEEIKKELGQISTTD